MKRSIKRDGSALSKKSFTSICDRREWTNNPVSSAYIKPGFSGVLKKKKKNREKKIQEDHYTCIVSHCMVAGKRVQREVGQKPCSCNPEVADSRSNLHLKNMLL